MRLFGYYALHTFVNQIRKLLKTWVLVFFLVCMVIGGVIGFSAAKISDLAETNAPETVYDGETTEEEETDFSAAADAEEEEEGEDAFSAETVSMFEAVTGLLILILFFYDAFSANRAAGKIFLPADVNILFPSPMKPQSVLMFRLMTQIGMMVFMGFYFLIQIPNLMNMGMTLPGAAACIGIFYFTIIVGTVLQLLIYIVSGAHPSAGKVFRYGLFALIAFIAAAFAAHMRLNGYSLYEAFLTGFGSPYLRAVPFAGWLKWLLAAVLTGDHLSVLISILLSVGALAAMVYLVWQLPADFYEDAMYRSEERAEIMRAARESRTGIVFSKRKKDRSETLARDGMRHGRGASVFFFKPLYNRFRFAHLKLFTKTMETYFVLAVGLVLFVRVTTEAMVFIPSAIAVAVFAFYRALGNPLEEDLASDYFRLVPESTFSKLFCSLSGGTVCCMMDAFPALLAAALLTQTSPLQALWWTVFVAAVDFFATCTGAFIFTSLPQNAGTTVKQLVQVMFLYFGLLPSIGIMAVGIVTDRVFVFSLVTAAVNLLLGSVFLTLSAMILDPGEGKQMNYETENTTGAVDVKTARKHFSRIGLAYFLMPVIMYALVYGVTFAAMLAGSTIFQDSALAAWILQDGALYLIGFPLCLLILRPVPHEAPRETKKIPAGTFIGVFCICIFATIAGALASTALNALLSSTVGLDTGDVLERAILGMDWFTRILTVVIIAPVMEEILFRKILIDRMRVYGERIAVVTSGLMFGMFHGNLLQVVFASLLGCIFGYVYLRTGRLHYTILLHMMVNGISTIQALLMTSLDPATMEMMMEAEVTDAEAILSVLSPAVIGIVFINLLYYILAFTGLVMFIVYIRKVRFSPAPKELPRGKRFSTVWLNAGMILFLLAVFGQFALSYYAASLV